MATIPDHFSVLRNYYSQLYKDKSLCDLSLLTNDGTTVLAHKLIVAAFCGAVRSEVEKWKDLPQVSIAVDCDLSVLHCILDFIYTGSVDCDVELLPLLNHACIGLEIPALRSYLTTTFDSDQLTARIGSNEKVELQDKKLLLRNSPASGSCTVNPSIASTVTPNIKSEIEDPVNKGHSRLPTAETKNKASVDKFQKSDQALDLPVVYINRKTVKKESSKRSSGDGIPDKDSKNSKLREKTLERESITKKSRDESSKSNQNNNMERKDKTKSKRTVDKDKSSHSQSQINENLATAMADNSSGSCVEKTSRTRANTKTKTTFDDNDFTWLDDDGEISDDIIDDNDLDEDYDPSKDRDDKVITNCTNKSRRSTRNSVGSRLNLCLKEPVIKLVRIDAKKNRNDVKSLKKMDKGKKKCRSDSFMYFKSQERKKTQFRFTKEYVTKLAQCKDMNGRKTRFKMKTAFSKEFISKIRHADKNFRKSFTVLAAEKVIKRFQEPYRNIEVNNTGFSCKTCRFWHTDLFRVRLHMNKTHQARSDWPMKRKPRKKKPQWNQKKQPRWVKRKLERIKRKTKNLQCFKCDKVLKTVRTLAGHFVDVHKWSAKKTQKLTGYPKYFAYHEVKGSCQACGKSFSTLNDLRAHNRSVHKKKYAEPDIPCKFKTCSQKFLSVTTLRSHLVKFHKMGINAAKHATRNFHTGGIHVSKLLSRVRKQEETIKRLMVSRKGSNPSEEENMDVSFNQSDSEELITNVKTSTQSGKKKSNTCISKKHRYNIVTPTRKYVCNSCGIPTIFQNRMRLKTHNSLVHKRILIMRRFESRIVKKKLLQKKCPSANDCLTNSSVETRTEALNESIQQKTVPGFNCPVNGTSELGHTVVVQTKDILVDLSSNGLHEQNVSISGSCSFSGEKSTNQQGSIGLAESCHTRISLERRKGIKRQYTCLKCSKNFLFYSLFSLHWQRQHSPKLKFRQRAVNTIVAKHITCLKSQYLSKKHGRIVKKLPRGDNLNCEVCCKLFANLRNLAAHLQSCHEYTYDQAREVTGYPTIIRAANLPRSMAISCMNCPRTYNSLRSLSIHLQNNHKYTFEEAREATGYPSYKKDSTANIKTTHKCEKCSKKFNLRKDLRKHNVDVHGEECSVCNEKFATIISLKRHGTREHPENISIFQALKTNNKSIWDSEEEMKKETDYKCEKCDFTARKLNMLTGHIMENHPEIQHNCPVCGYSFRSSHSVEKHIIKHHGVDAKKKVKCIFCDKRFLRLQFLRVHQYKVHGIPHRSIKEYVCDFEGCKKTYYTQNEFNQHQKHVHFLPKLIECSQCNFTTNARHKLLRHVRHVHLGLKAALCESCGKSFTTEQHMKTHYRRYHTNDFYNLQCEYCAYRCGARNELQTHVWHNHQVRLEDDTRQYWQCDQCTYSTPLRNKFINHMNGHNNVRNFICDQCDARFVTSSTMREHMKWKHSSPENVKICKHCGYKTKTNSRLNEHIRVQHQLKGVKPYKCIYCDFRSATNGNCRKHIMARHRDLPVKYEVDKEYLIAAKEARKDGNTNCLVPQEKVEEGSEQVSVDIEELQVFPQYITIENIGNVTVNQTEF